MKAKDLKHLIGFLSFLGKALTKLRLLFLSVPVFRVKDALVLSFLESHYPDLGRSASSEQIPVDAAGLPIWICWLQGLDAAPPLIKACVASVERHRGCHPMNLVTLANIGQYLEIPPLVLERREAGVITWTFLADIVRVMLLEKYGGMWIDATFYLLDDLPEEYFRLPLFSAAKQPEPAHRRGVCISHYRWTTSFLGAGQPGHPLFSFLKEFFLTYLERDGVFIDYLMFDYAIELAYRRIPQVKRDVDGIPNNNLQFDALFHAMNKEYSPTFLSKLAAEGTLAFKLSHRVRWQTLTKQGRLTFFGVLSSKSGVRGSGQL